MKQNHGNATRSNHSLIGFDSVDVKEKISRSKKKSTFPSSSSSSPSEEDSDGSEYQPASSKRKPKKLIKREEKVIIPNDILKLVQGAKNQVPDHRIVVSFRKEKNEENAAENIEDQVVTFVFEDVAKWKAFKEIIQSDNNLKEEYKKDRNGTQRIHSIGDLYSSRRGFPPPTRSIKLVCRSRNLHSQELAKPQRTTYIIHDKHNQCGIAVYAREHKRGVFSVTFYQSESFHKNCEKIHPSPSQLLLKIKCLVY